MSALFARLSTPATHAVRRATFSTSAPALKPVAAGRAPAGFSSKWSSLSLKTRRYLLGGLVVGTVADTYVYYRWFHSSEESE